MFKNIMEYSENNDICGIKVGKTYFLVKKTQTG